VTPQEKGGLFWTMIASSIKEVLALFLFCILLGSEVNTKKPWSPPFKISVVDPRHKPWTLVTHEIRNNEHKIKIRRASFGPQKSKVITLPLPLKDDWKEKVKLSEEKPKRLIENVLGGKPKLQQQQPSKGKGGNGRIVGGNEVNPPHSLPWQVALVTKMQPTKAQCGATILCPRFIMTAAHCVEIPRPGNIEYVNVKEFLIVAGAHNIRDSSEKYRTEHKISNFVIHPQRGEWTYDFAILDLIDHIKIRPQAKAAFLPKPKDQEKLSETTMLVSGWGDLESGAHRGSGKLMFANLPFVSEEKCMGKYGDQIADGAESLFCAGYREGGIDACQGDSGGPLTILDGDKVKLMGVVSSGAECALPDLPGLYGKVTHVLDWINKVTEGCNAKVCKKEHCATKVDLKSFVRSYV